MLTCQHRCWRNGGIGEKADYWQGMGEGSPIFKGKDMGDIKGVRFGKFLTLRRLTTNKCPTQLLIIET